MLLSQWSTSTSSLAKDTIVNNAYDIVGSALSYKFTAGMESRHARIISRLWPEQLPENLKDNLELDVCLSQLSTYKLDQLVKERRSRTEETKRIVEQTQDLAILNYKTFIQTAENTRSIFKEFQTAEGQVNTLIDKLPKCTDRCETFLLDSEDVNKKRRLGFITLKKNALLLEIMELPQLMSRCIRESRYEDALELATYVQKMGLNQGHLPIVNKIVRAVEALWHTMLLQLVAQLRTNLQLPKCLQIVGYLKRMQAFDNNELKLKFVQSRSTWLRASMYGIQQEDPLQNLTKKIEVTRINLFNIITQYSAIFPPDDQSTHVPIAECNQLPCGGDSYGGDYLFQSWLHGKIAEFLEILESEMYGITSFDTLLGQCMYFGLSFSRVGIDFRSLIVPIFVRVIYRNFDEGIVKVNQSFEQELETYTLLNKVALHASAKSMSSPQIDEKENESLSPPETLLDFHPLANLCNGYLKALNELRLCAPIALASKVTSSIQRSLEFVSSKVLTFYGREKQAFTGTEHETFVKLCACIAYDLLPFIQRCINAIFLRDKLCSHLATNLMTLEKEHMAQLHSAKILAPLNHILS